MQPAAEIPPSRLAPGWFAPIEPSAPDSGGALPELVGIQYLRGLAALVVVYFHAGMREFGGSRWIWPGIYGVDVFFVISGFIMVYLSSLRPLTPWRFLADRLRRVVPLYWVALAIAAVQAWRHGSAVPIEHLLLDFMFLPHISTRAPHDLYPVLTPGWTLNLEIVFYLLFTLALALGRWRLPAALAGLGLLILAGAWADPSAVGVPPPPSLDGPIWNWVAWDFYRNPVLLEFGYGLLLGQWFVRRRSQPVSAWTPGWLLGLGLAWLALTHDWPLAWRSAGAGLAGVALVAGAALFSLRTQHRPSAVWLRLGAASYAIYLFHILALNLCAHLREPLSHWLQPSAEALSWRMIGLGVLGSLLLGLLVHALVDLKLQSLLKSQHSRPSGL